MNHPTRIFSSLLCCLLAALPAQASSLPKADLQGHAVSLGTAPSLGLEFSLTPNWAIGSSAALPFFYGNFGFIRYQLHSSAELLHRDNLYIRGIVGVFGDIDLLQRQDLQLSPVGLEAGIGLAYRFNELFTGRLNMVAGIGFPYSTGWGLFPPGGGIEFAFHPFPEFEASIGFNGNGDILAIRYLF